MEKIKKSGLTIYETTLNGQVIRTTDDSKGVPLFELERLDLVGVLVNMLRVVDENAYFEFKDDSGEILQGFFK